MPPWCLEEPRRRGAFRSHAVIEPRRRGAVELPVLRGAVEEPAFGGVVPVVEEISSRDENEIKKLGGRLFKKKSRGRENVWLWCRKGWERDIFGHRACSRMVLIFWLPRQPVLHVFSAVAPTRQGF
jgi:hypothetical protein